MKRIEVRDKRHIKALLYAENVLGIKGPQFRAFGGFQLWWYDRHHGVCDCCESHWNDPCKQNKGGRRRLSRNRRRIPHWRMA